MVKVLLADKFSEDIFKLRELDGFIVDENVGLKPEQLKEIIADYDVVLIRSATRLPAEMLKLATNLKLAGRGGIGVDNIDIPAATELGIKVMNTPMANAESTAEHAIAMMFASARKVALGTSSLKSEQWIKKQLKGKQLGGQKLGLIGMGNIGKIVAQKCFGMGMDVVVADPYLKADENNQFEIKSNGRVADFKVTVVSLEELLKTADFISIHTPLTDETRNLLDFEKLSLIKPTSVLVNNSRGGVVNEEDLYKVLKEGKIDVAFDVFANEPVGKSNLLELENFTCTPHISASTAEAQKQVAIDLCNQIKAFFVDGEMVNVLNK